MAIISNISNCGTSDGGYKRNYANSCSRSASNGRSPQSYQSPRPRQHSCSDSDESERSFDGVDSVVSASSFSTASSSAGSETSNRRQRKSKNEDASYFHSYKKPSMPFRNLYIAMDCEMVATETGHVCARVVLVDWKGRTLLDTHVKSEQTVTDYLTFVSGITAEALTDAPSFSEVHIQVKAILAGKILVGHGLENDLASLQMDHPWWMIRDTAYYQPYMQVRHNGGESFHVPRKLKDLCKQRLKKEIQVMGVSHCPYEDAKAALDLYKSHRPRWESCVSSQIHHQRKLARQQMQQQAYYAMAPVISITY